MEVNTRKGKEGQLFALFSYGNQITIYTKVILGMENCFALSYNDDRKNEGGELWYFQKIFYGGGATAANQAEGGYASGGRGLSLADCYTDGNRENPRRITVTLPDGTMKEIPKSLKRSEKVPRGQKG